MRLSQTHRAAFILLANASSAVASSNIRKRNLQEDTTPPTINSFTPDAGVTVSGPDASAYTFRVSTSDESSIRSVKFQLKDPSGNTGSFESGRLLSKDLFGVQTWESSPMNLSVASGQWSWRVSVVDDSPAKNAATMPWTYFTVLAGVNPAEAVIGMIRAEIEALANNNIALRPKFLRLGFHDCVGGCDGCINLLNPDNAGLDIPIDALSPIVAKYAQNSDLIAAVGSSISRADIWALAALVGVDLATGNQRPEGVSFPMTHFGRVDCADSDADGVGGPLRDLPSPDLTTHGLLSYFEENFNFTHTETVCIMGAHSIGTARRSNSGFDGVNGWVLNENTFSNGYYDMLIGGSVDPTNFNDLIHAPQWTQELIRNTNRPTNSRIQWFHQKDPCGGGANCTDPLDDTRALDKIIMTNSDIALVRDLEGYFDNVTVTNADGTEEIVPGSVTSCSFRCSGQDRLTGCPNRNPPLCPHAQKTFDIAAEYKFNNDIFIKDFEAVLDKMLKNGYKESALVPMSSSL